MGDLEEGTSIWGKIGLLTLLITVATHLAKMRGRRIQCAHAFPGVGRPIMAASWEEGGGYSSSHCGYQKAEERNVGRGQGKKEPRGHCGGLNVLAH